jgi:hypothetical protein
MHSHKKGRGDLFQTPFDRIKVCLLNGYTPNQLIRASIHLQVVKLSILLLQNTTQRQRTPRDQITLISSQEPTKHECGSSFVTQQQSDWLTPISIRSLPLEVVQRKYETRHLLSITHKCPQFPIFPGAPMTSLVLSSKVNNLTVTHKTHKTLPQDEDYHYACSWDL